MDREEDRLLCHTCPLGRRCDRPLPSEARFSGLVEGETFAVNHCPRRYVIDHDLPLGDPFLWANRMENGILPRTGGWLEQPNVYVECMQIVFALMADTKRRWRMRTESESAKNPSRPTG